jgi:PKD repeat protein
MYADVTRNLTYAINWTGISTTVFNISASGIHIADPSICAPFNSTYGMMIAYNYNQASTYQAYYPGSLLQFFEQITGMTESTEPPTQPPELPHPDSVHASFEYTIDGFLVQFVETTYGGSDLRIWNFGDGFGSTKQNPTHKYISNGVYTVTLTVYDSDGHNSMAQTTIKIVLGPENPIERDKSGWNVYVSPDLTISVSAIGLIVVGSIMYVSAIFIPYFPVITPKGRKVLGAIMVIAGVYYFIFIENAWMT